MVTNGVSAVLSVFGYESFKASVFKMKVSEDMNLGAALMMKAGVNIEEEIQKMFSDQDSLEKYKVVYERKPNRENY